MNGDIGKLPTGAVYPATSEPLGSVGGAVATTASSLDYSVMNGELMLDPGMGGLEPSPQHIGLVGAVAGGFATVEGTPLSEVQAVPTSMTDLSIIGISLDQLKQMLSSQLEYYFSRENLANDTYLLSQMDNDQYVPIWTVANFNQVKKLTKDIKLITEVLRESPNVQVDEEGQKVRPNHKRCIVILREIPDNTPLEEVKNLFSGEGCPKLISCEFAHNSSWYVTFESDEDAQKAYRFLREEVREFQGKPIMARIKAKPMNRLPIPTVTGVGGIKNGYRTPPPPPPPPVYDPSSYSPGQQRFLYTNGTTMPQTTIPPYPNQVHLYHQPFYPTSMMHWGPASPAYFDMATGVFTMNGITPHNSFKPHTRFNPRNRNKHRNGSERSGSGLVDNSSNGIVQTSRVNYTPKNNGGSSGGGSMSGSGNIGGGGATSVSITPIFTTNTHPTTKSTSSSYQQSAGTKYHLSHMTSTAIEPQYVTSHHHIAKSGQENEGHTSENPSAVQYNPRHRVHRRTKDQEGGVTTKTSSNTLPAIRESVSSSGSVSATSSVVTSTANSNNNNNNNSNNNNNNNSSNSNTQQYNRNIVQFDLGASAFPPLPGLDADLTTKSHIALTEPSSLVDLQSQNRLSDVVKGTAKLKSAGIKDKDQTVQQQINISSRSVSPGPSQPVSQPVTDSIATSTVETESNTVAINDSPASSAGVTNISDSSDITLSTVTLTPPSSPDKSIKTDDLNMVNGVDETISTNAHAAEITVSVMRCDCDNPVATPNIQSQRGVLLNFSLDIHRPSYAQVAQHYCEQSCTKHRLEEKDGSN